MARARMRIRWCRAVTSCVINHRIQKVATRPRGQGGGKSQVLPGLREPRALRLAAGRKFRFVSAAPPLSMTTPLRLLVLVYVVSATTWAATPVARWDFGEEDTSRALA